MTIDEVRSAYQCRPFRSLAIRTRSGERYMVDHPEKMAIGAEGGVLLILPDPVRFAILDLTNITEILPH